MVNWIKRNSFKIDLVLYGGLIVLGVIMLVTRTVGAIIILPAVVLLVWSFLKRKNREAK